MGDIEQLQRSKRYLSFFSGLLFLDLVAGITDAETGAIGPVTLERWDHIGIILSTVVAFYFLRILNFRAAEGKKYKESIQYRIDDYSHLFIGANAILNGVLYYFFDNFYHRVGLFFIILLVAIVSLAAVGGGASLFNWFRGSARNDQQMVERAMAFALRQPPWYLVFANNVGQSLREDSNFKRISFESDGEIGLGQNHNESRWRIVGGFLEILNKSDEIFSRFSYDEGAEMFRATGDSDVKALPQQRIVRDVQRWDTDGRP